MLAHGLDAAAEVDALRADRRVEQLGERRRHRPPRLERAQDVLARGRDGSARAAAGSRRGSGRASCPAFDESTRNASPRSRQKASVSSRQSGSSGRTTPSSRRGLIPFVFPLVDEPVEDRLDLVARGVAGRAQPVRALARSGASRSSASPTPARVERARPRRRAPRAQKRASSSDSAPRRPWSTCSAETPVAELAQRVAEAGRVGAAGDEAEHLAARLDQLVPADVRLDPLEERPRRQCCTHQVGAASHASSTPSRALELARA